MSVTPVLGMKQRQQPDSDTPGQQSVKQSVQQQAPLAVFLNTSLIRGCCCLLLRHPHHLVLPHRGTKAEHAAHPQLLGHLGVDPGPIHIRAVGCTQTRMHWRSRDERRSEQATDGVEIQSHTHKPLMPCESSATPPSNFPQFVTSKSTTPQFNTKENRQEPASPEPKSVIDKLPPPSRVSCA